MIKPHRKHSLWLAHLLHRVSGLGLAIFLPVHFYVLSLAIRDTDRFNQFLHWTEIPIVKLAETGLVFLLAVHLFGGMRLLALEFLPWSNRQKNFAALAVGVAFFVTLGFLLRAI